MARKSRKHPILVPAEAKGGCVRVALYIRLSVEDNGNRGDSIETQRMLLYDFVAGHPEMQVQSVYTDNGLSGTHFNRPGFQQMLEDIEAGKIDCVIVKDLSRLGRNLIDTGYYIEQYFFTRHIRFIAITDNFDTQAADRQASVMLPIKNMVNEAYALDIGRKVRAQQQQAMRDGLLAGGSAPYGYRKSPDDHHRLIIDPQTAPIVRQIFEWALERRPLYGIAGRLNQAGILPPAAYKKQNGEIQSDVIVGHGKWANATVQNILSSRLYTGDMVQGKTRTVNHHKLPVPRQEWIVVRNTHEPIISREMFDRTWRVLKEEAEKRAQKPKRRYTPNLFQGKLFCMECGKSLQRSRTNKRSSDNYRLYCWYDDCPRKHTHPGALMGEQELITIVHECLCRALEITKGQSITVARFEAEQSERSQEINRRITEQTAALARERFILRGLYEDFVKGIIGQKEYTASKPDIELHIAATEKELACLHQQLDALQKRTESFRAVEQDAQVLAKTHCLTAELVNSLIKRIEISRDHEIRIMFTFRDEFVERRPAGHESV